MKLILGPTSHQLGRQIAAFKNIEPVEVVFKTFPDGETYVRITGDVRHHEVCIIQTTSPPQDTSIMQLALMADAAKCNGATKVTAIIPYLAYSRQDKVFLQGEAISLETVARMLNAAGVDNLITVNVHQETALQTFPFPARNVSAIPLLADYFIQKGLQHSFVLAPDQGAIGIAEEARAVLGGTCGFLEKHRNRYTGQVTVKQKTFDVASQTVIIFDDIISTGGTIVAATNILKTLDAEQIFVACVHPLLIGDAEQRILDAGVDEIVATDSVSSPVSKVTLTPLLSAAIRALNRG